MENAIEQAAGRVWHVLGEKGEVDISRLPRLLKIRTPTAYQAVGWLAREGKINEEEKDGRIFISLTERELDVFQKKF